MANNHYRVIMVSDSRALDLDQYCDNWGDIELDIVKAPSAGIEAAVEILIAQRRDATPDVVIIMNGICDILAKNKIAHKNFMLNDSLDATVEHYMKQVKRGQELLEIFYDESLWIFNPVTGADICDYNTPGRRDFTADQMRLHHQTKTPDPLQPIMNQAVVQINAKI